jgi:hypothetical protein
MGLRRLRSNGSMNLTSGSSAGNPIPQTDQPDIGMTIEFARDSFFQPGAPFDRFIPELVTIAATW